MGGKMQSGMLRRIRCEFAEFALCRIRLAELYILGSGVEFGTEFGVEFAKSNSDRNRNHTIGRWTVRLGSLTGCSA